MCDRIVMPDNREIESIDGKGTCLCVNTQREILHWIIDNLPDRRLKELDVLLIEEKLVIERDPFGYIVKITENEQSQTQR